MFWLKKCILGQFIITQKKKIDYIVEKEQTKKTLIGPSEPIKWLISVLYDHLSG